MADEATERVATLIEPGEYAYHLNEVVGVTTREIVFLKRKFASRAGHELVTYPVSGCAKVKYHDERPLWTIVSGLLLVGIIAFVAVMLVITWDRLESGTRVPVGLLGLGGFFGLRRLLGARRHRLVFTMKDGKRLSWKSGPGDYQLKRGGAERIVEFARARDLLDGSRLVRS